MLTFGLAMSIFRRSTCAPSGNSPAFIRRNRSRFSATLRFAPRARGAGLRQRPARGAQLGRRLAVDVGESLPDEPLGEAVELVVVVGRVVAVRAPVEAEPADRIGDRILVLDVLLHRVGVVEAQVAAARVLGGEPEIEADRLRVAVMEIAVRLGREARDDLPAVLAGAVVLGDDRAQEIRGRRRRRRAASAARPGRRISFAAMQHSWAFVHEQDGRWAHSNRWGGSRHSTRTPGGRGIARKPAPDKGFRGVAARGGDGFPQILWIIVCISCKFGR